MLKNYEIIQGNSGGSFTGGGNKIGLHSTEGSSIRGAVDAYRKWNSWPHFTIDPVSFRRVQHLELNVSGRALENRSGGVETNRCNIIQIEIIWFAHRMQLLSIVELDFIASVISDIRSAGFGFTLQAPRFYGAGEGIVLATASSPIRLQGNAWVNYSGIVGHQHVPENSHWDCGKINIQYILDKLGGGIVTAPAPSPVIKTAFPLPKGHWFGVESPDVENHSGYWGADIQKVRLLQQLLNKHGAGLVENGKFGNITRSAVIRFQKANSLKPDGYVGEKTWAKL